MEPVQSLRELFAETFGSPPSSLEDLSTELGGSARCMFRISDPDRCVIGVFYDVREENVAFLEFSRHFRRLGLRVPEIYAADLDRNVYLEEDLGRTTLYEFLRERRSGEGIPGEVADAYRKAAAALPRFQIVGGRELDYSACYPRASFDRQSIVWDLNYFKYCFLRPAGIPFGEQALESDFEALTDFLLGAERSYFLYRDFQARNIMLHEGELYFIDYQGGRRGALQYDIASLLFDAKADLPPAFREEVLGVYLEALAELAPSDVGRFMQHYYGYVYVRIMQALGAYGFLGLTQGKRYFLESVPYALANLAWLKENVEMPVPLPALEGVFGRMIDSERLQSLGSGGS
jgi:aminoglycoside/choline kinase family phosphotransferase